MWKIIAIISAFFVLSHALGEISIFHTPPALSFKGSNGINSEELGDIFAASLGHSVQSPSVSNILYINDPFELPSAALAIVVEGVKNIDSKVRSFPLVGNSAQESFDSLTNFLEERSMPVMDVDLGQGTETLLTYSNIFENVKVPTKVKGSNSLKPDLHSEDKQFLYQVSLLNEFCDYLLKNKPPTMTTVHMTLSPLVEAHGEKSQAIVDAADILSKSIENCYKTLEGKNMFFAAVFDKLEFTRNKRQVTEDPNLNLAQYYSEDYPVIFNIILWLGIVFAFALLAISYAIGTMDPGRDSIIYRMTSTRMKKEN